MVVYATRPTVYLLKYLVLLMPLPFILTTTSATKVATGSSQHILGIYIETGFSILVQPAEVRMLIKILLEQNYPFPGGEGEGYESGSSS